MGILTIERPHFRKALYLKHQGTKANPSAIIMLEQVERGELDQLIRWECARQGVTSESKIQAIIDRAEQDYEVRMHVTAARNELRRLTGLRQQGYSLVQRGFRKWQAIPPGSLKPIFKVDDVRFPSPLERQITERK